jgi:hypothetical protein
MNIYFNQIHQSTKEHSFAEVVEYAQYILFNIQLTYDYYPYLLSDEIANRR